MITIDTHTQAPVHIAQAWLEIHFIQCRRQKGTNANALIISQNVQDTIWCMIWYQRKSRTAFCSLTSASGQIG